MPQSKNLVTSFRNESIQYRSAYDEFCSDCQRQGDSAGIPVCFKLADASDVKTVMLDIAIIGTGLAGLSLAERLLEGDFNLAVFDARDRCGGRVLSRSLNALGANVCVDLGPTWLWPAQQPRMTNLINRLGLTLFRQWDGGDSLYVAAADAPPLRYVDTQTHAGVRRIEGGCGQLIDRLLARLSNDMVHLQHRLLQLTDCGDHVDLAFTGDGVLNHYQARRVVLAVPPRLLADSVVFEPVLNATLLQAMQDTPTWMAGHAKALLIYSQAFWRRHGYSGNALLAYPGAVLAEIYDACPAPDPANGVLFGFFGIPAAVREAYRGQLQALVVQQAMGLYGKDAAEPSDLIIQDWSLEPYTATEQDRLPPMDHPVYGNRALSLSYWQDKLYFCGTETALEHGGYLEGALEASERVYSELTSKHR